jgi:hypothetical protein
MRFLHMLVADYAAMLALPKLFYRLYAIAFFTVLFCHFFLVAARKLSTKFG